MKLVLDFHQRLALCWLCVAPVTLHPLLKTSTLPGAASVLVWGVVVVTVMILTVPMLIRIPVLRRWYGWTDALSERQRQALAQRDLRRYYSISFEDGYRFRVMPYLWRLVWTVLALEALPALLPSESPPLMRALLVFPMWYPMGVLFVLFVSLPIGRMLGARRTQ